MTDYKSDVHWGEYGYGDTKWMKSTLGRHWPPNERRDKTAERNRLLQAWQRPSDAVSAESGSQACEHMPPSQTALRGSEGP
jgi:hypothetical protein